MKKILIIPFLLFAFGCAHNDSDFHPPSEVSQKYPVVTIETSGDLYFEEGGENIQMDLFGNCSPGKHTISIEIDSKRSVAKCRNGRYRFSMNLPKTFFKKDFGKQRTPSSKYVMKEILAYHSGHKELNATSYILIDRKKREVKSVINKQVKYEKIPTGEYEPITQFNAFGGCTYGAVLKLDITAPDRYGHEVSKYDERKKCQKSEGYYFLSQIHGLIKKGAKVYIYEDLPVYNQRQPASTQKTRYKNLFNWSVPLQ